jgi:xanthine dehydrogenase YagT iron-sulfur-binding subunit
VSDLEDVTDDDDRVKLPDEDGRVAVRLHVNGVPRTLQVRTTQTLLDALRQQLKLGGARSGCGVGMCGACTVLHGEQAVSGCLTLATLCDGAEIRTVEGLARANGELSPVQAAFLRHRAFQCSYCTSGFVLALEALLARDAEPSEEAIREAFTGHLCRCGSYSRIMAAALDVAGTHARATDAEEA